MSKLTVRQSEADNTHAEVFDVTAFHCADNSQFEWLCSIEVQLRGHWVSFHHEDDVLTVFPLRGSTENVIKIIHRVLVDDAKFLLGFCGPGDCRCDNLWCHQLMLFVDCNRHEIKFILSYLMTKWTSWRTLGFYGLTAINLFLYNVNPCTWEYDVYIKTGPGYFLCWPVSRMIGDISHVVTHMALLNYDLNIEIPCIHNQITLCLKVRSFDISDESFSSRA